MGSSFYDQIADNNRNSVILMAIVFTVTFASAYAFSLLFFGDSPFWFGLSVLLSAAYIAFAYFMADGVVLAVSGARKAEKGEYPHLVNVVEGISVAAGIPVPQIYVMDDPAINAFATGMSPEKASVAFTTGLLSTMNRAELEGVVAHEISHIKNRDSRLATLAAVSVGLIAILSDIGLRSMFWGGRSRENRGGGGGLAIIVGLFIMILAPIAAHLVRLALSRQREYLADASGAQLTRYPEGLASALEKIKKHGSAVRKSTDATASLYFANPLSFGQLISTHPPLEERIRRLRAM